MSIIVMNESSEPPEPHSGWRSCDLLGVCQLRKPACVGCTDHDCPQPQPDFRFAPGVIEYGATLPKKLLLRKTLAVAAALGLTLGALGRWMGWI